MNLDNNIDLSNSLTSNTYWSSKPPWCQQWTIILTGILFSVFIWIGFKIVWLSLLLFAVTIIWWYLFLFLAPSLYKKID